MLRLFKRLMLGLVALVVVLATASFVSNLFLTTRSTLVDRLNSAEKARVSEIIHLRRELGDSVWPGWADVAIPQIVYNEEYAFLVGYPNDAPPPGWLKVPENELCGSAWEVVPNDTIGGQPYFRQRLFGGVTPQAFTVRVGDIWASSITTYEWTVISLRNQIRGDLPYLLKPVLPVRAGQPATDQRH